MAFEPEFQWKCPRCQDNIEKAIKPIELEYPIVGAAVCYGCATELQPWMAAKLAWDCAVCTESYKWRDEQGELIEDVLVCKDCIKSLYEEAYNDEANWPVRWGGSVLPIEWFEKHFDADFFAKYVAKEDGEYVVPVTKRIYCDDPCGEYVGRLTDDQPSGSTSTLHVIAECVCSKIYCLGCGEQKANFADAFRHTTCEHDREQRSAARIKQLEAEGQVRGKDFQVCPDCECAIHRTEMCNSMDCKCGTNFCYLCGKISVEGTAHFQPGGCARYPAEGSREDVFDFEMEDLEVEVDLHGDLAGMNDMLHDPQLLEDVLRERLNVLHNLISVTPPNTPAVEELEARIDLVQQTIVEVEEMQGF